jgi:hypothetical protein
MNSLKSAFRKIFVSALGILGLFGIGNASVEPTHVDIATITQQIEGRMDNARRKLLDTKLIQEQEGGQYPIAQWYNWPNWSNIWRNF